MCVYVCVWRHLGMIRAAEKTGCSSFLGSSCHGDPERRCESNTVWKPFMEVKMEKSGRLTITKLELVVQRNRGLGLWKRAHFHFCNDGEIKGKFKFDSVFVGWENGHVRCGSASNWHMHYAALLYCLYLSTLTLPLPPFFTLPLPAYLLFPASSFLSYPPPFLVFFSLFGLCITYFFFSVPHHSCFLFTLLRCPPRRSWLAMWWRRSLLAAGTRWRWWVSAWWAWPPPSAYCSRWDRKRERRSEVRTQSWVICVIACVYDYMVLKWAKGKIDGTKA